MGSITINLLPINDISQAFPGGQGYPNAGTYYPTGEPAEYGEPPFFGPIIYDRREIHFPGVDWTAEKDYKKLKGLIFIDLVVWATLATLRANVQSLLNTCNATARYTITLNGLAIQGCKLDAPNCGKPRRLQMGNNMVGEVLPLVFKQLSDTN